MELDFDKEIDALLRKAAARGPTGKASDEHLDSDAMAAFAAGVLPVLTRDAYTRHLADCDRCRQMLALTASFHEEAEAETAASPVEVIPAAAPWYKKFLGLPSLAYAMGALVLLLSGFIGYSLLLRSNESANSEVSQVYEREPKRGGPSFDQAAPAQQPATNSGFSNSSTTTANAPANSAPATASNSAGTLSAANNSSGKGADQPSKMDDLVVSGAPPPPLPAPSTSPADLPLNGRAMTEVNKLRPEPKTKKEETLADEKQRNEVREQELQKNMKDEAPTATLSAPSKAAGPRRDQRQQQSALDSSKSSNAPIARSVGGRSFEQKNGVWYDSAYRGQDAKTIRRGTKDYIKLDAGLRSIADSLGGTVVIVWTGKAYRIR